MFRSRPHARSPHRLLLASLLLFAGACDTRAPVGAHDGGAGDRGLPDKNVPPPPPCTCMTPSIVGSPSCDCTETIWGCKESPQRKTICDVPPECWRADIVDPTTGCWRYDDRPFCVGWECIEPPPPPSGCDPAQIGKPCGADGSGCGPNMTCLLTDETRGGVCTCPCVPDDPSTPLVNEDQCPDLSQNICAAVRLSDGSMFNFCARKCAPTLGSSTCTSPLACQPEAATALELPGQAVCLFMGCQSDYDCPVLTSIPCKLDTSGVPSGCAPGARCVKDANDPTHGLCARAGHCDKVSGLCAPRTQDLTPTAKVGDPCGSDLDCAGNQRCEQERAAGLPGGASCTQGEQCCSGVCTFGKCEPGACVVHARHGYCVIDGCAFASLTAYACPAGSSCNRLEPQGICQRTCELSNASSCRGNPQDKLGDYECRAWNNVEVGGLPVGDVPLCDFADAMRCNSYPSVGCDVVGVSPANSTDMSCRDASGQKLSDPKSPLGLCLDDTASGPSQP